MTIKWGSWYISRWKPTGAKYNVNYISIFVIKIKIGKDLQHTITLVAVITSADG